MITRSGRKLAEARVAESFHRGKTESEYRATLEAVTASRNGRESTHYRLVVASHLKSPEIVTKGHPSALTAAEVRKLIETIDALTAGTTRRRRRDPRGGGALTGPWKRGRKTRQVLWKESRIRTGLGRKGRHR